MERLLIFDGDPETGEALKSSLPGVRIDQTEAVDQAVHLALSSHPDAIVSEVAGFDAGGFLAQLAAREAELPPVIVYTGDERLETSRRIRTLGLPVFFYALKGARPGGDEDLYVSVHYALRWRRGRAAARTTAALRGSVT